VAVRILIVTQYFWPENFRINDVAAGLVEAGHRVTVLTGKPNYPEGRFAPGYGMFSRSREMHGSIDVVRAPLVARGKGGGIRLALNYLSFALTASIDGPLRAGRKFDAILVYEPSPVTVGLPALVMKAVSGAPVLFWVQDLWPESLSATGAVNARWVLGLVERLVRFIYHRCDRILIQSMAFREPILRLGGDASRVVYLPNSAEAFYRPLDGACVTAEQSLMPDGFRVMFAGNIGAAQGFATLIDAATLLREHADIQWVVLGDGRMREWAVEEVARRGLTDRVHFLGRHPPETMPAFFALADVLLVTLRRDPIFELTIPAKLQSYLACGRPIVAAIDGEGSRIVREAGAGLACPAEDPAALAQAVLDLHGMPEAERAEMGRRGREYFEAEFERGILLARLDRCIEEAVTEKNLCVS